LTIVVSKKMIEAGKIFARPRDSNGISQDDPQVCGGLDQQHLRVFALP
jgi:hypothetical protein